MKRPPRWFPILAAGVLLFGARVATAAIFTVTSTADDGAGTLRQALRDAKANPGADTIVFDLPGPGPHLITLPIISLNIDSDVSILNDRPGDEAVTIEGTQIGSGSHLVVGVFTVASGRRAIITGLTLSHGYPSAVESFGGIITIANCTLSDNGGGPFGGAINYQGTELTLLNCLVTRNKASSGGAIYYKGTTDTYSVLTATNCVFSDNQATETTRGATGGGAIYNFAAFISERPQSTTLALTNCTFANNKSGAAGGAIFDYGSNGNANIIATNCTFSANQAPSGGAIFHDSELTAKGVMKYENCTFSANMATEVSAGGAGAIHVYKLYTGGEGYTRVNNCTFSGNSSPVITGGITTQLSNTILSRGNNPDLQLFGVQSLGHNISDAAMGGDQGTAPGGKLNGPGDIRNTNPQLLPLADNGGSTFTHALSPTSPAINAGDDALAPPVDQRNYTRSGNSDIGAFEFGGAPGPAGTPTPPPTPTATPTVPPHDPLTVVTTSSSGDGSLRAAIQYANASPSNDTIRFDIPGPGPHVINLATQLPSLVYPVQIVNEGAGAKPITVRRSTAPEGSIFFNSAGNTVVIAGLTIANGKARSPGPDRGAAVYNNSGTLTLRNCVITGNTAILGGAIYNTSRGGADANLMLVNCVVSANTTLGTQPGEGGDGGGGIYNDASPDHNATVILTNCTLANNSAYREGGAIYSRSAGGSASVVLNDSTIRSNTAPAGAGIYSRGSVTANGCTFSSNTTTDDNSPSYGVGGALEAETGLVQLMNCTLSTNVAPRGAAVFTFGGATVNVVNTTIARNRATQSGAGGINNAGDPGRIPNNGTSVVNLQNTIVALNTSAFGPPDVAGGFNSLGNNLIRDSSGSIGFSNGVSGDQVGSKDNPVDPKLDDAQYNGGPTQTCALLTGSPAIDGGNDIAAPGRDQRGYGRSGPSDIGAYEFGQSGPSRLANISTRLRTENGDNALFAGFIVTGTQPKRVLVRALGPSLTSLGVLDPLPNPTLELHGASGLIALNDDWRASQDQEIAATTLQPTNDKEAAIVALLPAGSTGYTAIVRGANGTAGTSVVEVYDLDVGGEAKLANISTRGVVQSGDNVLIAGTIMVGPSAQQLIIRAVGPSLPLAGRLNNPSLELHNADGSVLQANDDWGDSPDKQIIIDKGLALADPSESAIVWPLFGNNARVTAVVRGANGATGIAVVEVYAVD